MMNIETPRNGIITLENLQNIDNQDFVNKVFCGDAIEVMKKMPENSVHLIITSPPYNVGIPYENHNDLLPYKEYLAFLENTWRECYRILVHKKYIYNKKIAYPIAA